MECQAQKGRVNVTFPDDFCENQTRPTDTEPCTREDTAWEVGPWSEVGKLWITCTRNVHMHIQLPERPPRRVIGINRH